MTLTPKEVAEVATVVAEIPDEAVASFLRKNPDFFERNVNVLTDMLVPHPTGNAISLIERQVSTLRQQNRTLKQQLQELMQIARENDRIHENIQQLTLDLMQVSSLKEILAILSDTFHSRFAVNAATTWLFVEPAAETLESNVFLQPNSYEVNLFKHTLNRARPCCGRFRKEQLTLLFPEQAKNIASTAILPLIHERVKIDAFTPFGMIAIGSEDGSRFKPQMDTLFLSHLSKIIATSMAAFLCANSNYDAA